VDAAQGPEEPERGGRLSDQFTEKDQETVCREKEIAMRALRKVLVVDDDPVVGKSFDRVLSEKGYEVSTALSGPEALKKLGEGDYDAVFTDIRMPGMDGIEVAERVKAKRPWIPVVIVTGYGTAANEARAKEAGVSGFLRKPLSPEMIEGSAREVLLEKEAIAAPEKALEPVSEPAPAAAEKESAAGNFLLFLKNVALFFAAPFVALAYVIAFPFIGLGMVAWMGARALAKRFGTIALVVKHVVMFVAAPFVALAYIIALPFVGLAMLAWCGARALLKRPGPE
jgi:CheY-like chemotaxis protein